MATPGRIGRKPTLETVAARAGVSKSLVSLVLRNSPKVSAASREAVMRAVAELGYRPNAAARLLAERQSRTVGVLLNDLRQPWFADMLDGLTPALQAGGKAHPARRRPDRPDDGRDPDLVVPRSRCRRAGPGRIDPRLRRRSSTSPARSRPSRWAAVAWAWTCRTSTCWPTTTTWAGHWRSGTCSSSGTRRIAHISGLPSAAGRLRMQGYQDTMRAAGLGGQILVETGDMTEEGGYRAAVRLLQPIGPTGRPRSSRPTTCPASGRCPPPRRSGVQVPGELSLVGFDNSHCWRGCGRCG